MQQHRKEQPSVGGRGSSLRCSGKHTFVESGGRGHQIGGESKKLGYIEWVFLHAPPHYGKP